MKTEFMKIFWGLVIVVVDISINELDLILPDLIGYALIYQAVTKLAQGNEQFAKARPFPILAAIAWLVSLFRIVPAPVTGIASLLLDLGMTWYICTGIMLLALERTNVDLARTAVTRRSWSVGVSLIHLVVALVALSVGDIASVMFIPLAIVTLTIGLLILALILRASQEIA